MQIEENPVNNYNFSRQNMKGDATSPASPEVVEKKSGHDNMSGKVNQLAAEASEVKITAMKFEIANALCNTDKLLKWIEERDADCNKRFNKKCFLFQFHYLLSYLVVYFHALCHLVTIP
jgi:hypothetical protein